MSDLAVLFPGQGAQKPDMLDNVAKYGRFHERADTVLEITGIDLRKAVSPESSTSIDANKTSSLLNVFVSSLLWDSWSDRLDGRKPRFAGYSVGQWVALFAAGAISFEDMIRGISARADLMDKCVKKEGGAMIACIGLPESAVAGVGDTLRNENLFFEISNYNCQGQYTISVKSDSLEPAMERLAALKPRKLQVIPVAGAWHCSLLKEAGESFLTYLDGLKINLKPDLVIDNVTGGYLPHDDVGSLKSTLSAHIYSPVRWEKGIRTLIADGCAEFVEMGYGNTLSKFGFFIDRSFIHRPLNDI